MSYEGYTQVLCEKGHYFAYDAYNSDAIINKEWECPVCKSRVAWTNEVNLTNGSYENGTKGKRIDGYIELKTAIPAKICKCKECGNEHTIARATFKIPKKKK